MVLRTTLLLFGLLEACFPKQVVDFWMKLAAEESDITLKPWVYTVARIEGVIFVLWALFKMKKQSG